MHPVRHLSCPVIAGGVIRPTPRPGRAALKRRYTWSFNPSGVRLVTSPPRPVSSYLTFSPFPRPEARLLFSVTLPYPFGYLPVRKDGALCCPDFPPRHKCRSDEPACQNAKIMILCLCHLLPEFHRAAANDPKRALFLNSQKSDKYHFHTPAKLRKDTFEAVYNLTQ